MEDHIYLLWWLSQRMTDELLWRRVSFFGRRSVAMIAVCSLLPSGRKKKSRLTHSLSTLESDSSRTAQGQTAHCFIGHLHCWQWQSDLLFKGKIQKKQIDSKVARIKATFSDLESIRTITTETHFTHISSVSSATGSSGLSSESLSNIFDHTFIRNRFKSTIFA